MTHNPSQRSTADKHYGNAQMIDSHSLTLEIGLVAIVFHVVWLLLLFHIARRRQDKMHLSRHMSSSVASLCWTPAASVGGGCVVVVLQMLGRLTNADSSEAHGTLYVPPFGRNESVVVRQYASVSILHLLVCPCWLRHILFVFNVFCRLVFFDAHNHITI